MAKVKVTQKGIPHFWATCYNCDWSYGNHRDRELGYSEIRKHVSKTGHTVHLEVGVHTDYSLDSHAVEHHVQRIVLEPGQSSEAIPGVADEIEELWR